MKKLFFIWTIFIFAVTTSFANETTKHTRDSLVNEYTECKQVTAELQRQFNALYGFPEADVHPGVVQVINLDSSGKKASLRDADPENYKIFRAVLKYRYKVLRDLKKQIKNYDNDRKLLAKK